jgi:hypothetical protein
MLFNYAKLVAPFVEDASNGANRQCNPAAGVLQSRVTKTSRCLQQRLLIICSRFVEANIDMYVILLCTCNKLNANNVPVATSLRGRPENEETEEQERTRRRQLDDGREPESRRAHEDRAAASRTAANLLGDSDSDDSL